MARGLNFKQLAFVKHYLGEDATLAGNATASYREAYQCESGSKSIHAMASKLLNQPKIKAMIERATTKATQAVDWSARTVLEESIKLYDRCMGVTYYPVDRIRLDKKSGQYITTTIQERSYNPQGARAALELIGRNTGIQAFQDNVEVSHTHYLEQVLARRAKALEGRATVLPVLPGPDDQLDQLADVPGIEADQVSTLPGRESEDSGQSDPPGQAPGRRSH